MSKAVEQHTPVSRRAVLSALAAAPAIPAVTALLPASGAVKAASLYGGLPPAGPTAASLITRAMALVDLVNSAEWKIGLSDDEIDDLADTWIGENHALFVQAAQTPCQTVADAVAKLDAISDGDRYAGEGLLMEPNGDIWVETLYRADVRAFLTRMQNGE